MKPRFISRLRLMPVVIALGAGLVLIKTSGLVHEAQAEEATATATPSAGQTEDLAGPEDTNASPAEVDILSTLARRRSELDGRARDLDMRANLLAATEKRVDDKIGQLKELQAQMTKLLNQRDTEQQNQVASLVKTYSSMKAKAAADIFANLDDDVLVPVAQQMKSDVLGPILAAMPPAAAQRLTVKLANRLILPKAPPAPPAALAPEASLAAPNSAITPAIQPAAEPAQKQAAITPAETPKAAPIRPVQLANTTPAAKADTKPAAAAAPVKPEQPGAKPPVVTAEAASAAPAAVTPAAVKPAAPTAEAKAATAPEAKIDAPATPIAPAAPAAPPAATIH